MNIKATVSTLMLLLCMVLGTSQAWGQELTAHGKVVDQQGDPLIGVTVQVTAKPGLGTITNFDGEFSLRLDKKDILTFSYVGFQTREIAVSEVSMPLTVTLLEDRELLDEVVVIGYGSLDKKELSSSIVQISKESFNQGAMNNPMEMVAGKVAGLNVSTSAAADPNASSSLQIRGATSISASNGPLVVVDGIAGADIRNIAAQDIESITVLKDAGSAAIYGTRGANGVILITTKKGSREEGTPTITYDSYVALNVAKPRPDILSPEEFRRSRRGVDYGYDTDWYSLITRKAAYDTNQYLSIDGSTKNGFYGASLNYKRANGLDIISNREEYGARLVAEQKVIDNRLTLNSSLSARRVNEVWGDTGYIDTALNMNPTMPVKNEDGTYYQPTSPTGARNPVSEMNQNTSDGQRLYLLGSADAKYSIFRNEMHDVNTSLSYSLHYNDLKQHYYTPSTAGESFWNGYNGRAEMRYQKWWTNRLEWLLNYSLDVEEHNLKLMLGYSYEQSNWEQMFAQNNDFTFDNTKHWGIGSGSYLKEGKAEMYAGKSQSVLAGFFGRLNYNWRNLIFASTSLRYEGSSKFGANNKWGYFPAASLAVELTELDLLSDHKETINSLKPRVSYGVTGRSDFGSYLSLSTYSTSGSYLFDGTWTTGYAPSVNANPNLAWEKSVAINVGVDFSLWNRLRGSIEYFDRRSEDLLYRYTAPQPPFVYDNILVNVGTTQNQGVELSLEADVVKNEPFAYTTGIVYSFGETTLRKLSNDVYKASYLELYQKPGVGSSEYFFRIAEKGKIGQFYGYEYSGVDEHGNMLILDDKNNEVPVSQADPKYKRYIGNGAPRHFLSWNNFMTYKNWDLSFMFNGAFGFDIFNMRKYGMGLQGAGTDNVLRSAYLEDKAVRTSGGTITSFFLENGSYFKLSNLTLGYTFVPENKAVLQDLRLYLSAKNLFTLTKYSGNDPSIVRTNGIEPGVDVSDAYPTATQLSLGVTFRLK